MKKVILVIAAFVAVAGIKAQSNKEDIDLIQAAYGKDKKELVKVYMDLKDPQATAFWKVYDQFETERKTLGKARIAAITEYADHFTDLKNEQATSITKKILANDAAYNQLYIKYFEQFSKATSAVTAAKFLQIEIYLQTIIKAQTQDAIPFIGEIEALKKEAAKTTAPAAKQQ